MKYHEAYFTYEKYTMEYRNEYFDFENCVMKCYGAYFTFEKRVMKYQLIVVPGHFAHGASYPQEEVDVIKSLYQ